MHIYKKEGRKEEASYSNREKEEGLRLDWVSSNFSESFFFGPACLLGKEGTAAAKFLAGEEEPLVLREEEEDDKEDGGLITQRDEKGRIDRKTI